MVQPTNVRSGPWWPARFPDRKCFCCFSPVQGSEFLQLQGKSVGGWQAVEMLHGYSTCSCEGVPESLFYSCTKALSYNITETLNLTSRSESRLHLLRRKRLVFVPNVRKQLLLSQHKTCSDKHYLILSDNFLYSQHITFSVICYDAKQANS